MQFRFSKKIVKSPLRRGCNKGSGAKFVKEKSSCVNSSQMNCDFLVKFGKVGSARCTPEGKKRRRARFVKLVDIHSSS